MPIFGSSQFFTGLERTYDFSQPGCKSGLTITVDKLCPLLEIIYAMVIKS